MKAIKYLFQLVVLALAVGMTTSCARDYDEPPFNEPEYTPTGTAVTVDELKAKYSTVADPTLIDTDFYLKANVVGNDVSGNIFKQIYVQDATGGIQLGVDQNNVAAEYGTGQQVYIQLRGLYILKYGGEFQLGYKGTNANRIPWEFFKEHVHRSGFAKPSNAAPRVLDMNYLYATSTSANELNTLVNTLVTFEKVHFVNGGDSLFIRVANGTTEDPIKDIYGNTIAMRTSSYASPFVGKYLPKGNGTVTGVLGRHNGNWQLVLRDFKDADPANFDGKEPEVAPKPDGEVFKETFGNKGGDRLKIAAYGEAGHFDMKAPIKYSDKSGFTDVRALGDNSFCWLPNGGNNKDRDTYLTIEGINTKDYKDLVLTYDIAANLYNATDKADLNAIGVEINGVAQNIKSQPVSNAGGDNGKFYTITIDNFPAVENVKVEFISKGSLNEVGFRIDNITIKTKENVIVPSK